MKRLIEVVQKFLARMKRKAKRIIPEIPFIKEKTKRNVM